MSVRSLNPVFRHRLIQQLRLLVEPITGFGIFLRHGAGLLGDVADVVDVAVHLVGHQTLLLDGRRQGRRMIILCAS